MLRSCTSKLLLGGAVTIKCVKPVLFCNTGELVVRYAGHSHWQNIRHVKAKSDAFKCKTYAHIVWLVERSLIGGGSVDPKSNDQLRKAIEEGKAVNMPRETIDRTIKRIEARRKNPIPLQLLYRNRNRVFVLVLADAFENTAVTLRAINKIAKAHGFVKQDGDPLAPFLLKGYILAKPPADAAGKIDQCIEDAIEVEAEEVVPDEEQPEFFKFLCGVGGVELHKIKTKLQSRNYTIENVVEVFVPRGPIEVDEDEQKRLSDFVQDVEDNVEAVKECFANIS